MVSGSGNAWMCTKGPKPKRAFFAKKKKNSVVISEFKFTVTLPNIQIWYLDILIQKLVWIFGSTYRKGEILMQMWHVNSQCVLLLHEIHIGVGVAWPDAVRPWPCDCEAYLPQHRNHPRPTVPQRQHRVVLATAAPLHYINKQAAASKKWQT